MQQFKPDPEDSRGVSTTEDKEAGAAAAPKRFPFSWGAFSFPALWLMAHDQVGWGGLVMLFTALVNTLCWMLPQYVSADQPSAGITVFVFLAGYWIMSVALGIKEGSIAWKEGIYSSVEELKRSELKWTIVGLLFAIFNIWGEIVFASAVFSSMRE
jgi:hypothetical protein